MQLSKSMLYISHNWASVPFCAADVDKHEKDGDQQCHAPRNPVDWYQKSDEGDDSQ